MQSSRINSRILRAAGAAITTLAVMFGSSWLGAVPASALETSGPGPIAPRTDVTADALPTVQINGVVWKTLIVGDTVYAGGEFTNARPAGSAAGVNTVVRSNLLAFSLRTGALVNSFAPTFNGRVKALAVSPDGSRLYVGGGFTTVNGVTRNRMAAFDIASGNLVSTFAPSFSSSVNAIQVTSSAVFVGGLFNRVGSVNRPYLAALRPSDGALLTWAPVPSSGVQALALTPDQSRLVVGGNFATMNGAQANGLTSVSTADGSAYPFPINEVVQNYGDSAAILFLTMDPDGTVYGGGYAYGGATHFFEGLFAANSYTGAIKWLADCHGDTYDSARLGNTVYAVSHHHYCGNIGGFPDTNPRNFWQRANAFTVEATGTVAHDIQGYPEFYGQPAPSLVNWFPTVPSGTYTGQSQGGWTLASTSEYVVMGGEFPSVNGTAQQGLARFAIPSLATNKQGPRLSAAAFQPSLLAITPTKVRVKWPSNWDRDDMTLRYDVYREGLASPIYSIDADSTFWNLPSLSYDDTTVIPGQTYRYRVRVTDPSGNLVNTSWTPITVPTSVSAYQTQVLTDAPSHYWRMGASGTWPDYAGTADLTSAGTVAADASGAINSDADPATAFDGATGTSGSSMQETGPNEFTIETWFKTTSTSGGKIVGFGDAKSGTSSSYDRHIFLDNAGHVVFGVYPNGVRTVASSGTFNDGAWHHVVATLSPVGMKLWLDGVQVGARSDTTFGQDYQGYWRVGGDNLNGWPNQPASTYLAGSIDEVAVYPVALTRDQVRSHYTASGRTLNTTPLPTDGYAVAVNTDAPTFFWRLGDSTSVAADSSGNEATGTYYNGVTRGVPSTVAPDSAATFNGSDGLVSSAAAYTDPQVYSVEAWFNTTTTGGGKIVGFGDAKTGTSSNYDRHVYLDPSGRLNFGVWTGQANVITSSRLYNDGAWHHVVASQGAGGMTLTVDGQVVGTNPNTAAQPYTGYWRVGGDTPWAGNTYFAGTVDEVAVYDHVLTLDRIRNHYRASGAATNLNPTADFTVDCLGLTCQFNGGASSDVDGTVTGFSWTFGGDGAGTGQVASHTFATGGTYSITLQATDDAGGTATVTKSVNVRSAKPAPVDTVGAAVYADDPIIYWRLDDTGTTAEDASAHVHDGVYSGGVTRAQTSPVSTVGSAAAFNGSDGGVGSVDQFVNPTTYSTETWFNTTSTGGGKIIGFGNVQTGFSGNYDRHVYLTPDGRLNFGAWTGFQNVASSTASYNDGAWHHMVATQGADGMKLYVDGVLVGTNGNTAAQEYNGYWRIGGDWAWDGSQPYFPGLIDEAAVYDKVLSLNQVRSHYRASAAGHNALPTADFTSTCTDATCGFAATASDVDGSVSGYSWNFGDGVTGSGASPQHGYSQSGTFTVTLTVTDDQGGTTQVSHDVDVTVPVVNQSPTAVFTSSTDWLTANFVGTGSSDPDGTIAAYSWNFGDGQTGTGETTSHDYATGGTYDVTLSVTDNLGATASVTHSVTVNGRPTASFTVSSDGRKVTVDGSASADPDGTIASYAWDYGDGATGTGTTDSHTYASDGLKTITLVVKDDKGAESVAVSQEVTVTNAKPTASFTVSSNGLRVSVDASDSTDPDGTVASYAWDYGDGTTGTGKTDSHTFTSAGAKTITLVVTDNAGTASDPTAKTVTVTNAKPAASFTVSSNGLKVSVDASDSTDPDGTVASYAWDYGDGTTGTGKTDSHTYASGGAKTVTLVVTDSAGAQSDPVTRNVTVSSAAVADDFGRTVTRWGAADTGGTWTYTNPAYFTTNGSVGVITLPKAGAQGTANLDDVSVLNSDTTFTLSPDAVSTGGGLQFTTLVRKSSSNDYRLTVNLAADGSVRLNMTRRVSGTTTSLGDVKPSGLTYAAGDTLRVRFVVTGQGTTTLQAKVWKDGTTEPASAQMSRTDSTAALQTAGSFGTIAYLSGTATAAPAIVRLDNLRVVS
jgi:PKD repeat protein